jgi:hypothetical protein
MFGTALLIIGIAGLAAKFFFAYEGEPPEKLAAKVVKIRLDIKKSDGKEYYTYITTFYIHSENRNISFLVTQQQFDDIAVNDCGVLTCCVKKRKFINWELKV